MRLKAGRRANNGAPYSNWKKCGTLRAASPDKTRKECSAARSHATNPLIRMQENIQESQLYPCFETICRARRQGGNACKRDRETRTRSEERRVGKECRSRRSREK